MVARNRSRSVQSAVLGSRGGHARTDLASTRRQLGRVDRVEPRQGTVMSDSQVVGFLGRKITQAMNDEDGDLSQVRQENFNYYIGQEYGNEREGYSKHVTREVLETIEWVLPSVLRVFSAGDKIVTFDPESPEDEEAAEQETDIANYYILKGNKGRGFLSLHHWFKDALMYPNGYIKIHIEEKMHTDVGMLKGLTPMAVQMVVDDPEVEILEQRTRNVMVEVPQAPPQPGQPPQSTKVQQPVEVFDLKIRTTKMKAELRLDPVPPEECLVDNDCLSLDLDTADFVCHRVRKTYSQLIEEGFDMDRLDSVGIAEDHQWNDERVNRLFYEDEDPDAQDEDDPSMREFWVHECYAWYDYDGDGLAEFRKTTLIGDQVFDNEETNFQPMVALSSILMQHKHTGMSYADIVKDLQLLQSVLTRQLLDNVYKINVRRKVFSEDALTEDGSTIEAMLNTQTEFIPVRGPAQNAMVPEQSQPIIGDILPVIQHIEDKKKLRTGVAPELSLDPAVLQESTMGAFMGAIDQASQRIEMLVRIFAETGMRFLMLKVHQLLRTHWDIAKTVKIRGTWVDVDPQGWRDRTDMTVNVGLGFNNKQQMIVMLTQLLNMQKEALPQGMSTPGKLYNTLERIINAAGVGDVRAYFVDPDSPEYKPPEPPPPDAQMILAQAQAKALEDKAQLDKAEVKGKLLMEAAKNQQDGQLKAADIEEKQKDRELKVRELALDELRLEKEYDIKEADLVTKVEKIRADVDLTDAQVGKTEAETELARVEASDTAREAQRIVTEHNEDSDDGESDEET